VDGDENPNYNIENVNKKLFSVRKKTPELIVLFDFVHV